MAALSADAMRDTRGENSKQSDTFAIKTSATLYIGSHASFTTAGRLQASAAATGLRPGGIVVAIINESGAAITAATGNAGGTIKATIEWGHQALFTILTAARTFANLGKNVFIANDNELTDTTAAGTALVRVKVGKIIAFTNTAKSEAWVAIGVYGDADAV